MNLLDQHADAAIQGIKTLESVPELEALATAEAAGKNRPSVTKAIAETKLALTYDPPPLPLDKASVPLPPGATVRASGAPPLPPGRSVDSVFQAPPATPPVAEIDPRMLPGQAARSKGFNMEPTLPDDIVPGVPENIPTVMTNRGLQMVEPIVQGVHPVRTSRPLVKAKYCWLDADIPVGTDLYMFRGSGYRHIPGSARTAVTYSKDGLGDYFEVPKDAIYLVE